MRGMTKKRGAVLTTVDSPVRLVPVVLAAALLAGCGPATDLPLADAGAPEALPVASADTPPAAETCVGGTLPLTGLCTGAGDGLYVRINANYELPSPHCVWRPQEVAIADGEALVFRALDCSQGAGQPATFSFANNILTATYPPFEPGEPSYDMQALEVFSLAGEPAEAFALKTLDTAPENQRARCEIQPLPGAVTSGPSFRLSPDDSLRADLEAAAEEGFYDACGLYGATDSATWWEARGARALFHSIGQDDPAWDPASFTFYARSMDGGWIRAE